MSDLMEFLEACPTDKTKHDFSDEKIILELRGLGFKSATKKRFKDLQRRQKHERIACYNYRVVTNEAIEKFLERKVLIYNQQPPETITSKTIDTDSFETTAIYFEKSTFPVLTVLRRSTTNSISNEKIFFKLSKATNDASNYDGIGQYQWTEVLVENYPRLPPRHVLDEFKEHKERNLFDYFTIASVNEIPDPILFGRIKEDKDRRWFIAQWGEDVCLDDLV